MCIFVGLQAIYELGSNQKYVCFFIRVTHAIKLCLLETEEFFKLIFLFIRLNGGFVLFDVAELVSDVSYGIADKCRTSRPYHSITPVNQEEGQVNGFGACKDKKTVQRKEQVTWQAYVTNSRRKE
jgi:hypothetical protein